MSLGVASCADVRPFGDDAEQAQTYCYGCHGTPANGNAAPPPAGWRDGIGPDAHQAHLKASDWHHAVTCDECHVVPAKIDEPGHLDDARADVGDGPHATLTWGPLATADGATPRFTETRCLNTYCHGATLDNTLGGPISAGGAVPEPDWYVVDGSQAACGSCHGNPPPAPHPQSAQCASCHPEVIATDGTFANAALHIDGQVQVGDMACDSCHGSNGDAAPPVDTLGNSATTARGVGAHQQHLSDSSWRAPIACSECHLVPATIADAGHVDSALPAELVWGPLASAHETTPSFDGITCSNTYCHGATMPEGGGTATAPVWTLVDGSQSACGSCHGMPPAPPHLQRSDCEACHGATVGAGGTILAPDKHINGVVDVAGTFACNTCHGDRSGSPTDPKAWAPPDDTAGRAETTRRGVGAHQAHLQASDWRAAITCDECHQVPTSLEEPGHADDALPAELTWGRVATKRGAQPAFNGTTCSDVYCHGAKVTNGNGSNTAPTWTNVGAGEAGCGDCHGLPPAAPHPTLGTFACGPCHDWTGITPNDPATHINGAVNGNMACGSCHAVPGTSGAHALHYGDTSAPPIATYGDLRGSADYDPSGTDTYMYGCGNCHPVDDSWHMNGDVEVELYTPGVAAASLKALNPTSASYTNGKCQNVYCHSNGQALPTYLESPAWDGGALPEPRCSACHGNPPSYPSGGAGTTTANTHIGLASDGWELGHYASLPGNWHSSPRATHGQRYATDPVSVVSRASPLTCQNCHYDSVDPTHTGPSNFYYFDTSGDYDLGGSGPYDCLVCHNGTTATAAQGGAAWAKAHANGHRDVIFDPRTTIPATTRGLPPTPNKPSRPHWYMMSGSSSPPPYVPGAGMNGSTWSLELSGSTYNPATKTCSNIPCHINQSFGTGDPLYDPLRWGKLPTGTCNDCHQY